MRDFGSERAAELLTAARNKIATTLSRLTPSKLPHKKVATELRTVLTVMQNADGTRQIPWGPNPYSIPGVHRGYSHQLASPDAAYPTPDQPDLPIHKRPCLFLDFDGPVCSVFAGLKDYEVAERLRQALDLPYPEDIATANDPFKVFKHAATFGEDTARKAEKTLTNLEVEAMRTAEPTKFAHDLIKAFTDRGGKVVIVSNNSGIAVDSYLTAHGLRDRVAGIYSRGVDPEKAHHISLLKPDPFALDRAMAGLGVGPGQCIFVGDTAATDIVSARRAGMVVVAFADKPGKLEAFAPYSPDATTTSMGQLYRAVSGSF